MERGERILLLARAIEERFSSSHWAELAILTGVEEYVDHDPRLLRSLQWGDNDYKGNVIDAVKHILDKDAENLRRLIEYPVIAAWLEEHEPDSLARLRVVASGIHVPDVRLRTSSEVAREALADAQSLLTSRGPTSAVDRIHTGLHGFLKAACAEAGIAHAPEATPNQLLKALLDGHGSLMDLGPRSDDMKKIIRTSGAIFDAMGTLRNRASLAHPNDELLDHDEALFVINIARSLLSFLDSKFSAMPF
jgi:hypothetical protein